jgi:hypothetical protein
VPEVHHDADADTAVGDVEGGVDVAAEVKVQEVDDVAIGQAVDEVADDAAAEQAEAELDAADVEAEGAAPEEDRDEGAEGEAG